MSYDSDMEFEQIPLTQWPDGLCEEAFLVTPSPGDIKSRTAIKFAEDNDDLDVFDAAIIRLSNGTEFALRAYRHAPGGGTEVILQKNSPNSIACAITLLAVEPDEVSWSADWATPLIAEVFRRVTRPGIAA